MTSASTMSLPSLLNAACRRRKPLLGSERLSGNCADLPRYTGEGASRVTDGGSPSKRAATIQIMTAASPSAIRAAKPNGQLPLILRTFSNPPILVSEGFALSVFYYQVTQG